MIDTHARNDKTKGLPVIKSDVIVETHHHRRGVKLKNGPKLTQKFNFEGKKVKLKFKVEELVVFWREGEPAEYVMAYGKPKHHNVMCRLRYEADKVPAKLRDILGEDMTGARK